MDIRIFNRYTGSVLFTAHVDTTKELTRSQSLGLAVRMALADSIGLSEADLSEADLSYASLYRANLSGASLSGASLSGASLYRANLYRADLTGANLYRADLSDANLTGANLSDANLSEANLPDANLTGANLTGANLSRANLYRANLSGAKNRDLPEARVTILPEGELIGWKKCKNDTLVKLKIPADARRSNATGRKCRAEYAEVLEVIDADEALSCWDNLTLYRVGYTVRCREPFDEDRWAECASGIHFFITRAEAEDWEF